jgi:hypothetical protein
MNEFIDSTVDRIHVCFAVLLASVDPRTIWSFSLVAKARDFTWSTESRTIPCYELLTNWQLYSR